MLRNYIQETSSAIEHPFLACGIFLRDFPELGLTDGDFLRIADQTLSRDSRFKDTVRKWNKKLQSSETIYRREAQMREQANRQLIDVYHRWLEEIKVSAPELLGKEYSNPYFSSIPQNWFEADGPRIMVVGEEGFGTYGCGKQGKQEELLNYTDIEKIQYLNYNYLRKQLKIDPTDKLNGSAFWRRFRRVAAHGICCWTNIDKIHVLGNKNCALTETDRNQLHSVATRVLSEEIEILDPTHIVFFGWYGTSLRHELAELYQILYPAGPKDSSVWNKNVVSIQLGGRTYIFCYHPNWGYRNKGYEDKVDAVFQCSLQRS